ncbi:hypothetical protein AALF16_26035 [Bacillus cereus]|uniref:hypothetical protein n=1 Tax=Bacillus cereus TaxID=1396 RepID=UPI00356DC996
MKLQDIKEDKSLWEKMNIEDVGKVLLVEESYYDGIVELVEKAEGKEQIDMVYIVVRENDDGSSRPYEAHKTYESAIESVINLTEMYEDDEEDINGGCRFYVESLYLQS